MEVLAFRDGDGKVEHPGTHNGHPLSAAAGIARSTCWPTAAPGGREAVAAEVRAALCAASSSARRRGTLRAGLDVLSHLRRARDDPVALKRGVPEPLLSALQCAMLLEGVHLFHGTGLLSIAYGADEVELAATAFTRSLARLQDEGLIP